MEGEINNLILVWTTVFASLCYCHTIGKTFPSGTPTTTIARPLLIFPIICLFFVLPQNLTSINFGATTTFFISWLANFKLILFAFNKGPLYSNPPIPLHLFIPLSCFPIKLGKSDKESQESAETEKRQTSPLIYVRDAIVLAVLFRVYDYKKFINPKIILLCYCLHIYASLELLLGIFALSAKTLIRAELEPQFKDPYRATSLQDFWGRRWNLSVSNILHPTVYKPVRAYSARFVSRKWAPIPAISATFLVSGLMHELIFYNFGRVRPNGQASCFFLLHGFSLSVEIVLKHLLNGRFRVPGIVSGPLVLAYVILTSIWLFFPPFLRAKAEVKACTEVLAFVEFVINHRLVSPSDLSCPYL
ncbi:hypothetical protein ACJIZ3_006700 [Penstemon smallii]|uniref:Wax synthase domain-containing protein n=1 Tax=Penstemon smallii TaxID=265156 RepID=A0ABD3S8Q5_9LAMI